MWGEIIAAWGVRLLEDVGWDYCIMLYEIIGGYGVRLLEDVGWDYCMMWCEIMNWDEIIRGCGVRLLQDVGWDYCRMWGEIIASCGMRLLEDMGWDYWRMWGEIMNWDEIIAGCGVRLWFGMRLLEDVGWDYCRMWCAIIAGCGVRLLEDVGWDYWRMWFAVEDLLFHEWTALRAILYSMIKKCKCKLLAFDIHQDIFFWIYPNFPHFVILFMSTCNYLNSTTSRKSAFSLLWLSWVPCTHNTSNWGGSTSWWVMYIIGLHLNNIKNTFEI